ncbi:MULTISPECIES: hypothetical protein [unclassified Xanthomonas]|uniref:hypothetical protein n=1 Tax=unclassified Xanthomonas TaxID=2643310 RepID=UPI001304AAAC|nr:MULTISPECIES: hypothetical protein [unclassified Xanthomonas]
MTNDPCRRRHDALASAVIDAACAPHARQAGAEPGGNVLPVPANPVTRRGPLAAP